MLSGFILEKGHLEPVEPYFNDAYKQDQFHQMFWVKWKISEREKPEMIVNRWKGTLWSEVPLSEDLGRLGHMQD